MFAALGPDRKALTIAVVNATHTPQSVSIAIDGARTTGKGSVWRLTGASLAAENKVGAPPGVTIRQSSAAPLGARLVVPAISTSIYEFPLTGGDRKSTRLNSSH